MKKIVFFGDVLVDLVQNKNCFFPQVGGSIFNTAISVAKSGHNVSYISQVGSDYWGNFIIDYCNKNHIDTTNIYQTDKIKTSLAFAIIDKNGNATYDFYTSQWERVIDAEILSDSFLFHFGSTFALKQTNIDNINGFLGFCKHNHILVSYDPNFRKGVSEAKIIQKYFSLVDIVKLSDEDIAQIYPDLNQLQAIDTILNCGVQLVVLTLGSKGAKAFTKNNQGFAQSRQLTKPILNTIGAGDNFNAGMIDYISNQNVTNLKELTENQLCQLCHFGNEAAAIHLER